MQSSLRDKVVQVAVFVSGNGTNLQALIDYEQRCRCPWHIALVVSDRTCAGALTRAAAAGISTVVVSPGAVLGTAARTASRGEKRAAVSDAALVHCTAQSIDVIVLAGFLTVLTGKILSSYAERIINIHPSLLPKFGGEGMWGTAVHDAVIAARETESGCTVHLVDAGCDTGTILVQRRVPVLSDDTPERLACRIAPVEHEAIVAGVCLLAARYAAAVS
ncbi:MAG: phosphoribosylglycinamide formyltransferase [Treponema sp.]|nr:phosphoribosylglycinamide formyltransferase [Treponema sp.]